MKKLSPKQKAWQIAHAKKAVQIRTKQNKRDGRRHKHIGGSKQRQATPKNCYVLHAPEKLSLFEGQEETLAFFDKIFDFLRKHPIGKILYFNLYDVQVVTSDAIMYLIALLCNLKSLKTYRIKCMGNMPRDAAAKAVFEKVGFFSYVYCPNHSNIFLDNDNIQISNGHEPNGILAGNICDFVHKCTGTDRCATKRLFPMIIELMTNTKQHAYRDESGKMEDHWYIFAEKKPTHVHFVFLDTGVGIPTTVQKRFAEIVAKLLKRDDAKLISSALRGEFRTETKQEHRGKGLPQIYSDSCDGIIENLSIISGNGRCDVDSEGTIIEQTLCSTFIGTLFCWDFMKH